MKILVTHTRPHLDDVCGIWLYRRFVPSWSRAAVKFISIVNGGRPYGGRPVDTDPDIVHFGVARGQYDEHKGDLGKSAAVLVWEDLRRRRLLPQDRLEAKALQAVVYFVLEGDLGKHIGPPEWAYSLDNLIRWIPDSRERIRSGSILLEALLNFFKARFTLDRDWKRRKEFKTRWGRGVGLISTASGTLRAYADGLTVVVQIDPQHGYRSIRARADSRVNLTRAWKRVQQLEPGADWYLHHSRRLLICGDEVAPGSKLSKLSLEELIKLLK